MAAFVGRSQELERVDALLESDSAQAAALVLEGAPGIGKTTLWQAGVEYARARSRSVLRAQPSHNEGALPLAALADLLDGLPGPALSQLDDAERRTVESVLRGDAPEREESLAVPRAVLATVRSLAEQSPVVVAVDDVQWLDQPSAAVLEYVLRRCSDVPLRLLLARRGDAGSELPLGLDRAPSSSEIERLTLGPLSLDELGDMLRARLGLALARPRLAQLHSTCAGNPFYALEIGRVLRTADLEEGEPLPVPESLSGLLHRRLDALPAPARLAALLAASSPQPTVLVVGRAAGDAEGLAEAVRRGVIEANGARLRFTHPLLASTIYSAAAPWERRDAHACLAKAAETNLERAFHLARSTLEPDEPTASELVAAAAEAAARGAPETAGELMERAAQLSVPTDGDEHRRRLVDAAAYHLASGDPARCRGILQHLADTLPRGPERARVLLQLADVGDNMRVSIALCEEALREAEGEPSVGAEIHLMLAILTGIVGGLEHARSAAALAGRAGDELVLARALCDVCYRQMMLGLPFDEADVERALAIERCHVPEAFPAFQSPSFQHALICGYTDRPDEARPALQAELERLERLGNDSWQIGVCLRLADVELRAGNWSDAARFARKSMSLGEYGIAQEQTVSLMIHGLVQAHLGNLDEARGAAWRALVLAEEGGDRGYATRARAVLGFADLSAGEAARAADHLAPATAALRDMGTGELSVQQVVQNEIEALVALGRLDDAEATIALVEEKGRPTGRAWHEAVAARGRALVAAARGDFVAAREHLDRALAAHERLPQPFELGRTLLAQGSIERRAKHRAAARESLIRALDIFDQLGAPLWAEKATAELARIPGRRRTQAELSETERRVAELVASGLSNKEVAAKLFVAVRTVEGNLTRIYGKLGVHSRTELAAQLRQDASPLR